MKLCTSFFFVILSSALFAQDKPRIDGFDPKSWEATFVLKGTLRGMFSAGGGFSEENQFFYGSSEINWLFARQNFGFSQQILFSDKSSVGFGVTFNPERDFNFSSGLGVFVFNEKVQAEEGLSQKSKFFLFNQAFLRLPNYQISSRLEFGKNFSYSAYFTKRLGRNFLVGPKVETDLNGVLCIIESHKFKKFQFHFTFGSTDWPETWAVKTQLFFFP